MLRLRMTAGIAMTSAVALTACGGETADGGTDGSLTLSSIIYPTSFDPAQAEWGNRSPFYQAVYDTLLLASPDGEIEPWLATDWEYNDDNTELTLTLRDDVTFTDGTELTADVVVENIERFRDGSGPDVGYMRAVDDVLAPADHTVVFELDQPDPALLDYLTRSAGLVGSVESFDDSELATTPVGSGPYELDVAQTVTGTSYVYTANPDYWNPDVQHYDEITINVLEDATAALNAIRANEADGVRLANNDELEEVESAGWAVEGVELDVHGILLLDRDGEMAPELEDLRVRQALNHAFDRESMLESLQGGAGGLTGQMFPETSAAYDPALDEVYPYDPDRAIELLAEAGYPDGFTIEMPRTAVLGDRTFTLIEQQLSDIGVSVNWSDPGNNFISDLLAPQYPASYMALEQNPDWQLTQFMLAPDAPFNPFGSQDPEVEELIEDMRWGDEEEQAEAASELNVWMVENAWFAPFYRAQGSFAVAEGTTVEMLPTNVYPNIYDFRPAD